MEKVRDLDIGEGSDLREICRQMFFAGGFMAKNFSLACSILEEMLSDKDCLKFLSFPGNIVATGIRGIIKDFVKRRMFDVIVTTCGSLDHDIARSFKDYYHGSFDVSDEELHRKDVHRLGNIFIPRESYGVIIEEKVREFLKETCEKVTEISTHELCWEFGKRLGEDSFLYWAWKRKVPVIVPGIVDGAVGYQLWLFSQDRKIVLDLMRDEKLLSDLVWNCKKSGALIIGGGISKHHVIWHNQFKGGLDYGVYITTATEYDGSLSGARTKEAISWGKIKEAAKHVTLLGDATVYLPFIYAFLIKGGRA